LNENIGKRDQKIWESKRFGGGGMKRFLIYLFAFPAIAMVALYAVIYVLTGAVVDSLSGPAFVALMFVGPALAVALVDGLASRRGVINGVVAATLFACAVCVLAVVWAGTRDVWVFGFVGAIPAAVCSWLSIDRKK
jgi:hypothetical protein